MVKDYTPKDPAYKLREAVPNSFDDYIKNKDSLNFAVPTIDGLEDLNKYGTHKFPPDLGSLAESGRPYMEINAIKFRERNIVNEYNITHSDTLITDGDYASTLEITLGTIFLPLPLAINNTFNVGWEMQDNRLVQAIRDFIREPDTTQGNVNSLAIGVNYIGSLLIGGAFSNFQMAAINPKKQAVFNEVSPRTFEFSWTFYPQNQKEADTLHDISDVMNIAALPSLGNFATFVTGNGLSEEENKKKKIELLGEDERSQFLLFPDEFRLTFHNVNRFPKISPCVCTQVSLNYAPEMLSITESGHTSAIQLTLAFIETSVKTKQTYKRS